MMDKAFTDWKIINEPPWREFSMIELNSLSVIDGDSYRILEKFGLPFFTPPYFSFCENEYEETESHVIFGRSTFDDKVGVEITSGKIFNLDNHSSKGSYLAKSYFSFVHVLYEFALMVEKSVGRSPESFLENSIDRDLVMDLKERITRIDSCILKDSSFWNDIFEALENQKKDFWDR